ncbi:hypothetical protein ACU8V6_00255 [Vibrio alginolyticus]
MVLDDAAPWTAKACSPVPRHRHHTADAADRRHQSPSPFDSEGLDLVIDTRVIAPADLMFDSEETSRALDVDEDRATEIREATAGFPALIRALVLRGAGTDTESLRAANTVIEDYLQDRLAECGFSPQALQGLLRMSVTDSVDLPLAVALTRDPDIAKALDQAETFGFARWTGDGGCTFTLTPLTRGMLRRELRRSFPGEVAHLPTPRGRRGDYAATCPSKGCDSPWKTTTCASRSTSRCPGGTACSIAIGARSRSCSPTSLRHDSSRSRSWPCCWG